MLGPKARYNAATGRYDLDGDLAQVIRSVEAMAAARIDNVTAGSVATQLPRGPGAGQLKPISNGYNDTYAAYFLNADANHSAFTFVPAAGTAVKNPIFVIRNYATRQVPHILVGGAAVMVNTGTADSGAFVSLNTATQELWVTLNRTLTAATDMQIMP